MNVERVADFSAEERAEMTALSLAVYPMELWADWPGFLIEWGTAEWCVRQRDAAGNLISFVGIFCRSATFNGSPVKIGGLSNVKTHPSARGRGLATNAIHLAVDFLRDEQLIDFASLVAELKTMPFYARMGWRPFDGKLWVIQRGERAEFTFLRPMTLGAAMPGPTSGEIDLCGLPW